VRGKAVAGFLVYDLVINRAICYARPSRSTPANCYALYKEVLGFLVYGCHHRQNDECDQSAIGVLIHIFCL
jgi:hypothetical protein